MEELNINPTEQENSEKLIDKEITRREFLRDAGILALGAFLASCAPKGVLKGAEGEKDSNANVKELNLQFNQRINEFVNERGVFNYEKYSKIYPEFDQYIESIDMYSVVIRDSYGIHPGVMKALASSILVANVDRKPDESVSPEFQQVGIMGLVPRDVLPVVNKTFGEQYSIAELEHPKNSIYFAMIYMAETLKDMQNDGENRDLMTLMLANYYGGIHLQNIVKGKSRIEENRGLKKKYDLFNKTLDILGRPSNYTEHSTVEMEDVWNKVITTWPDSKFAQNKDVFYQEVEKYYQDPANERLGIDKQTYLALFTTIARAESKGGDVLYNENSGAVGWYQLIPEAKHLEDYNQQHFGNYTYEQLEKNDTISITVGIWALMRYRFTIDKLPYIGDPDMHRLLKFFKAGRLFLLNRDDALWWNRVSYGLKSLLGRNPLDMQYIDYMAPRIVRYPDGTEKEVWEGPFSGSEFEQRGHMGVMN